MHQTEAQNTIQFNTNGHSHNVATELDVALKILLRKVPGNTVKVDVLCYFTRLATTGYYRLDDDRLATLGESWQLQVEWLAEPPAAGYHAASFPSTQELATALSHSEHRVLQAA
jgi:hypothetical protein